MQKEVTLSMGNGGEENSELIKKIFYKYFKNDILEKSEDAAVVELEIRNEKLETNDKKCKIAMTTDSFTVSPIFFNGGDIGKLAVCGTCNDLAMMGAKPKYLTISFIIEESFSTRDLEKIARSIKKELEINGAIIVSGDTKVMPKGSIDKIIINTTGVGEVLQENISASNLSKDDVVLISRDIAKHGATIFIQREGIGIDGEIKSDCASLYPVIKELIDNNINLIASRDATRGGVAALLNEWARSSDVCIEINEDNIPLSNEVKGVCELLGFEPLSLANEGTFCISVKQNEANKALDILKKFNKNASILGKVALEHKQKVIIKSSYGTRRVLEYPTGELLPRIC